MDTARARPVAPLQTPAHYGVEHVQRLDFNLGYLDLRKNGGGDPATVALLSSYLFDQRTHLNDIYDRPRDATTEYWTSDTLAGRKYGGGKKVYVLVSKYNLSGGEDLA